MKEKEKEFNQAISTLMNLLKEYYIKIGFYEFQAKPKARHTQERLQEIQKLKKYWGQQIQEIEFNEHRPDQVEIL